MIFFGNNGKSGVHLHTGHDYVLNQISGTKTVYMFDYRDNNMEFHGLFSDRSNFTKSNFFTMDKTNMKIYKALLEEGDSLMIPPWWWHNAISNGFSCSITKKYKRDDMSYIFKYPKIQLIFIGEFFNCDLIFDFVEKHFKFSLLGYWFIFTLFLAMIIFFSKVFIIFSILS